MTKTGKKIALALGAVALFQSAALGWMIWDRVSLIRGGRQVILEIVPVDPRSLFRGDYVRLGFKIAEISGDAVPKGFEYKRKRPAYVTLKIPPDGPAAVKTVSRTMPPKLAADEVVIRGRMRRSWVRKKRGRLVRMRYGIERYFVPEGEGRKLERLVREKKMSVLVAISADGEAAIKGLLIDGKLTYEEPLF